MIDNLPYLAASCVGVLPVTLHQEIINLLCFYILPFTISEYLWFEFFFSVVATD